MARLGSKKATTRRSSLSIAFGYTGAGEIEGVPTDTWLQERLGEGTDVQSGLQAVLDGLDRSFPPASTPHAFVGVGWGFTHEPVPTLLFISNCIDAHGDELDTTAPRFSILEATLSAGSKAYIHQIPDRIHGDDWARLQAQVAFLIDQGNDPAEVGYVLIEAVRRVADDADDVGHGLMINCLPCIIAVGGGDFSIVDRPSMLHQSFAYLAPGETKPGDLGPRWVSAEGGWLAGDFRHEEGPGPGYESVQMSFKLTREGASPPALVMRYQPGNSKPFRLSEREKIGRNDPCWCGSDKKFKKCHGSS